MIEPIKKDDALIEEIRSTDSSEGIAIWWLGQSGFLIKHVDQYLIIDPYLSDSLTRKYADTDNPHVRMTEICVAPERLVLSNLVVTSSHNHTDHLDRDTLIPLLEANPELSLVVAEANRRFAAERLDISPDRLTGVREGRPVRVGYFEILGVPSAHATLEHDGETDCSKYMGYVVTVGEIKIYHPGDTLLYDGLVETLRPLDIDVALLPINGSSPNLGVPGNLDGEEAARLAHEIGARLVIPCHYELFEFNTASPKLFIETCHLLGQPYQVLRCGERAIFS